MSITMKDVTKVYKSKRGVFDVTFDVDKGEVYGLLGPNGAGKTTILKLLVGLLQKDIGLIAVDEIDYEKAPSSYKEKVVGMIGDTVLYDYMSL